MLKAEYIMWKETESRYAEGTPGHAFAKRIKERLLVQLATELLPLDSLRAI